MTRELEKQILVAGVGNAWLQDDAFGAEVARRLAERELPSGVSVMDVGTSGLDLAYEVMRGYSALVIVDVSRQGGEPGTLYVIDVEPRRRAGRDRGRRDDRPALDGPDDDAALRARDRRLAGPGAGDRVRARRSSTTSGIGLTPAVEASVERAIALVLETVEELRTDAAYPA